MSDSLCKVGQPVAMKAGDVIASELAQLLPYFETEHLPNELAEASHPFGVLAKAIADANPYSFETVAAVRLLLQAKDCAVRAVLMPKEEPAPPRRRGLGRPGASDPVATGGAS